MDLYIKAIRGSDRTVVVAELPRHTPDVRFPTAKKKTHVVSTQQRTLNVHGSCNNRYDTTARRAVLKPTGTSVLNKRVAHRHPNN
jgi:hypothetical protein